MYEKILVALDLTAADRVLLPHVSELASHFDSHLILIHVADGWAARNYTQLKLAESEEMRRDREYLETTARQLREAGRTASIVLAMGSPPEEILKAARDQQCDLIAMGTHGHRFIGDLVHGSTISEVRHLAEVPVLLVQGQDQGRTKK
jgi:nucleotide-binding universal stress UspA family protein